jgi:hypothetical protein
MPGKDASGSAEVSDWTRAWEAVSRLAAAAPFAVQEIERDRRFVGLHEAPLAILPGQGETSLPYSGESDQLARAVAEIERAAAALRRTEPALEIWRPDPETGPALRSHASIWLLIGAVWVSAIVLIAFATSAIIYLFG